MGICQKKKKNTMGNANGLGLLFLYTTALQVKRN